MADRVWRWTCLGLALGTLPLLLAYGVRAYYLERPPTAAELLGAGDALLIAVGWCATALLQLTESPAHTLARRVIGTLSIGLLAFGAVAYGCLTADSVTGRVQTRQQAATVARWSVWCLAGAAVLSTGAAVTPPRKEDRECP